MDSIAEALRIISNNLEAAGAQGRMRISFDCPVKITVPDGSYRTTVSLIWTEDGLVIPNLKKQAQRIAREIETKKEAEENDTGRGQ